MKAWLTRGTGNKVCPVCRLVLIVVLPIYAYLFSHSEWPSFPNSFDASSLAPHRPLRLSERLSRMMKLLPGVCGIMTTISFPTTFVVRSTISNVREAMEARSRVSFDIYCKYRSPNLVRRVSVSEVDGPAGAIVDRISVFSAWPDSLASTFRSLADLAYTDPAA
jgi:hypothetical protein